MLYLTKTDREQYNSVSITFSNFFVLQNTFSWIYGALEVVL